MDAESAKPGEWTAQTGHYFYVLRGAQRLQVGVTLAGDSFLVLAVEVTAKATDQEMLDNHAHKILGRRKTLAGAKRLAERVADQWRKAPPAASGKCPCGPMRLVDAIEPQPAPQREALDER